MTILVASENAGTGKTTLVTNLAVLFKESENNVLIVDATQNDVARNWRNARNKISSDVEGQVPPPRINYTSNYNNFGKKFNQLNKKYDRVIVDCESGISSKSDILSKFESAASVAHMVIFPFRASEDFDTLRLIVEHIKKAKKSRPKLVACAVITMYSEEDLNETEIDDIFAEYVDTVTLIKPFIHDRDVYQQALNKGESVIELEDEEAKAEIRELKSALAKIYNNRNKILPAPTKASETDEEGNTQEKEFEKTPYFREDFVNNTDCSLQKFSSELEGISTDDLAMKYKDVFFEYQNTEIEAQMMKGLILLEAKKTFKSNKQLGQWVNSIHTLCVDKQQVRNRYMHLASFFKSKPMGSISLTAAYEISKPSNKDVAEVIYEKAKDAKLSVEEVKKLIDTEKSNSNEGVPPKSKKITGDKQIEKVLKQISGFNLTEEEQVKLLTSCISKLKIKISEIGLAEDMAFGEAYGFDGFLGFSQKLDSK